MLFLKPENFFPMPNGKSMSAYQQALWLVVLPAIANLPHGRTEGLKIAYTAYIATIGDAYNISTTAELLKASAGKDRPTKAPFLAHDAMQLEGCYHLPTLFFMNTSNISLKSLNVSGFLPLWNSGNTSM